MNSFELYFLSTSALLAQGGSLTAGNAEQPKLQKEKHPNIIWITCEDISPYMSAYGADVVRTPNIDQLAREGVQFQGMYTVAGVSAPSRSCLITGMYPTSIGTQHMRTRSINKKMQEMTGVPPYDAVLPPEVHCFPEYMRQEGYYTTNCQKEDYQFNAPVTVWDESSAAATYRNRPSADTPFFCVFNLFVTHESQLMGQSYLFGRHPELLVSEDKIKSLPPYYKDTQKARACMARMLSNVQMMDYQLGEIIRQLKADGVYDDAYVFFFSDHGGTMPWMKREVLERGTHIPFVVKMPRGQRAGTEDTDLHSSVDIAPTVLSLAGIQIPSYMQGKAFLGSQASGQKRQYVYAGRDRMDECLDRVRSVRDSRYRYIYNYMPQQPKYQPIGYRLDIPMMKELLELNEAGQLDSVQADWFQPSKPQEELYDVANDPDEIHNLASDPRYQDKLVEMRKAFRTWTDEVGDLSFIPEYDMVMNWWHGVDHQPQTAAPVARKVKGGYLLSCPTPGASIGYKVLKKGSADAKLMRPSCDHDMLMVMGKKPNGTMVEVSTPWQVYRTGQVVTLQPDEYLVVNATRIGYTAHEQRFDN